MKHLSSPLASFPFLSVRLLPWSLFPLPQCECSWGFCPFSASLTLSRCLACPLAMTFSSYKYKYWTPCPQTSTDCQAHMFTCLLECSVFKAKLLFASSLPTSLFLFIIHHSLSSQEPYDSSNASLCHSQGSLPFPWYLSPLFCFTAVVGWIVPRRYVYFLIPRTWDCDIIWKKAL